MPQRKLVAGNWKMHGTGAEQAHLATLAAQPARRGCDVLLCLPATLIHRAAQQAKGRPLLIGGQDCHAQPQGAYTGDMSALMLADAGATHVILGHSERRTAYGETSADVRAKAKAALAAGLVCLICLGESLAQRRAGQTLEVIGRQLEESIPDTRAGDAALALAYEPIWAIGSGLVPTPQEIATVHGFMRQQLVHRFDSGRTQAIALLYGGSVKGENAATIAGIAHVDGVLVGGASLDPSDFLPIVDAFDIP